jgi:hypothetical protein
MKEKGEVTPTKYPLTETKTSNKIKVSLKKPSVRKKSQANKPKLQTALTIDDIGLIITTVSDTTK